MCAWRWPSTPPRVPLASELSTLRVQYAALSYADGLAWDLETLVLGQVWFFVGAAVKCTTQGLLLQGAGLTDSCSCPWDMPPCSC